MPDTNCLLTCTTPERASQMQVRQLNSMYVCSYTAIVFKAIPWYCILGNTAHACCFVVTTADLQLPSSSLSGARVHLHVTS